MTHRAATVSEPRSSSTTSAARFALTGYSKMLSSTYVRLRQYSNALEKAKQEVRNNCIDDFKIGAALTIGESLLLLGRYREAQPYLCDLAAESILGATFGCKFTAAGVAFWFDDKPDQAVELWEEGLRAAYQGHVGMELPWVLLYAAARRPDCYSLIRAKRLVREKSQWLKNSSTGHINAFVLQRQSYDTTMQKLAAPLMRFPYRGAPAVQKFLLHFRSQLDFYAGVHYSTTTSSCFISKCWPALRSMATKAARPNY